MKKTVEELKSELAEAKELLDYAWGRYPFDYAYVSACKVEIERIKKEIELLQYKSTL